MTTPRPKGHSTVVPFLVNENMDQLVDFLVKSFNAEELYRLNDDKGKIWHSQIKIGDSVMMAGDSMGQHPASPMNLYVYVDNADEMHRRAIDNGATSIAEPSMQFYGDRVAAVKDFAGNIWWLATHQEDLSYEDMTKRAREMMQKRAA
ncbi:MAG: VOC family protein [Beijerinckiaceae bacterium]